MLEISIMGKENSSIEFMIAMLVENAHKAGINLIINHDLAMDDLLSQGVTKLPAVRINGKIMAQEGKELIDFFREVNSAILRACNFGSMKRIIVPIDFSDCSRHAMDYAIQVAKDYHAVLQLIYVYTIPIAQPIDNAALNNQVLKNLEQQLAELQQEVNSRLKGDDWHTPLAEATFSIGNVANEIVDFATATENPFIIIGSKGDPNIWEQMFGTVSTAVIEHSRCPVLIIPPHTEYKKLQQVAYFSNDTELDKKEIDQLLSLIKPTRPFLHLLHKHNDSTTYLGKELLEQAKANYYDNKVGYHLIEEEDFIHGLTNYCAQKSIDMLALSKKHSSFLEQLFHKSFTKQIKQYLKLPLLVMHEG